MAKDFRGLVSVDGIDLHVAHQAAGEGPPLLLFNGIGANLELLDPLVDALAAQRGRRIPTIRLDIPGTGGSPVPRWPRRMRALARLGRGVVRRFGYAKVDVLGVSWGGALAQEFAYRNPVLCRRAVLCATSMGMVMVPAKPSVLFALASPRRYFGSSHLRELGTRIYGGGFGGDADVVARFTAATRAPDPVGYYWQILAGAGWTSAHYLPLLRQPVLVVTGADDPIIPLANARMMATLARHSVLHVVKGGGHLALLTHATELVPLIHRFLTEGDKQC